MSRENILAEVHTLYESGFYRVLDFRCKCDDCSRSKPEYSESFVISFVRSGNFYYDVFKNSFDAHTGRIIISKPYFERVIQHTEAPPDKCTLFEFTKEFYHQLAENYRLSHGWFFGNPDVHAMLVKTSPEAELLHAAFVEKIFANQLTRLLADELVIDLVETVMKSLSPFSEEKISNQLKKNHLKTIESAKEFFTHHSLLTTHHRADSQSNHQHRQPAIREDQRLQGGCESNLRRSATKSRPDQCESDL